MKFFFAIAFLLTSCTSRNEPQIRPQSWAMPLVVPGVKNLHRVSPDLYRCQQPDAEGFAELESLGIKTIVNLRSFDSGPSLPVTSAMTRHDLTVKTWRPRQSEVLEFLKIATNPLKTPVVVHCKHGSDRTGAFCAAYRVVVQNWTKKEAIREMKSGGYGFHHVWQNLPAWIHSLDVEGLRNEIGLRK